jgi:hypothetical protein
LKWEKIMTIDMTNNRVPYGLLTDEEKAALHEHGKAGGGLVVAGYDGRDWPREMDNFLDHCVYRTVPLPKTQDVIAWDRLPDWVEWVARDEDGTAWGHERDPVPATRWWTPQADGDARRIDDFPGIVQIGTCDWKDSKQRRPRG